MGIVGMLCDTPDNRIMFGVENIDGDRTLVMSGPCFKEIYCQYSPGTPFGGWKKKKDGKTYVIISLYTQKYDEPLPRPELYRGMPCCKCRFNVLLRNIEKSHKEKPGYYDKLLDPGTVWMFTYQTMNKGDHETHLTYYEYEIPKKESLESKLNDIFS